MKKHIYLQRPQIGDRAIELVRQVIESKNLVEGKMAEQLENAIAYYVGAKFGIACTSATVGLELCLRALEIGKGDEVVVPDFTHPATALAVMTVGAEPIFADVDIVTYNVTFATLEEVITNKTTTIIPVSLFGNPLDFEPIWDLAEDNCLWIIEDAACSLSSTYQGNKVGSLADFTVFSFHPRKLLATGDGGMITTDYERHTEILRSLKHFGVVDGKFEKWGTNARMPEIVAAVGLSQMDSLNKRRLIRFHKAMFYDELLKDVKGVRTPKITQGGFSNYQTYAIYIEAGLEKRNYIMDSMRNDGIEVQIGTHALHMLPAFKNVRRLSSLSNSSLLYNRLLALPLHEELTDADQGYVVDKLKGYLNGKA